MSSKIIICLAVAFLCILTSCSIRQFYPTGGAVIGGSVGALTGNPVIAGLTAGSGAMLGEMAKGNAELEEAKETITALSHGDVEALVAKGVIKQNGLFQSFTDGIKKLLIIVGVLLICYLFIPVFVAKKCSQQEVKRVTRAPFPIKPEKNEKL